MGKQQNIAYGKGKPVPLSLIVLTDEEGMFALDMVKLHGFQLQTAAGK